MDIHEIASKYAMGYTLGGYSECNFEEVYEACEASCEETKLKLIEESEKYIRYIIKDLFEKELIDGIIKGYKNYLNK